MVRIPICDVGGTGSSPVFYLKMMAQIVNSTSLRLKKRLNWLVLSNVHNFNDYSNLTKNILNLIKINNNIKNSINITYNTPQILKSSKNYSLYYRIIDSRFFLFFTKLISSSKKTVQHYFEYKKNYLKLLKIVLKNLLLNQKQFTTNISTIQNYSKLKLTNEKLIKKYQILSPKLITEFVKIQISEINLNVLKKKNFNSNLQANIIRFMHQLLLEFNHTILGIKIVCNGR